MLVSHKKNDFGWRDAGNWDQLFHGVRTSADCWFANWDAKLSQTRVSSCASQQVKVQMVLCVRKGDLNTQ